MMIYYRTRWDIICCCARGGARGRCGYFDIGWTTTWIASIEGQINNIRIFWTIYLIDIMQKAKIRLFRFQNHPENGLNWLNFPENCQNRSKIEPKKLKFLKFSLLDSDTDSMSSFTTSFKLFFQTSVKSFKHFCCVRHKLGSSWLVSDFLPRTRSQAFFGLFLEILILTRFSVKNHHKVWNDPSS